MEWLWKIFGKPSVSVKRIRRVEVEVKILCSYRQDLHTFRITFMYLHHQLFLQDPQKAVFCKNEEIKFPSKIQLIKIQISIQLMTRGLEQNIRKNNSSVWFITNEFTPSILWGYSGVKYDQRKCKKFEYFSLDFTWSRNVFRILLNI